MDFGTVIPGYDGYTITENGNVFKGVKLLHHLKNAGRSARVKLKNSDGKPVRIAVAKLLAVKRHKLFLL